MMSEDQKGKSDKKDGIKPSQVLAAALAAVTAAFLGSTLGVAGTVAGAGIASVVSSVGGELYLRSLRKTKEAALALTEASTRQQAESAQPTRQMPGQRTDSIHPAAPGWAGRPNDRPAGAGPGYQGPWRPPGNRPVAGGGRFVDEERTVMLPQLNSQSPVMSTATGKAQPRRRYSLHWPLIIGTSVAAFVIAILAITGFEGVTGKAISGDHVTTVGHLWDGVSGQPDKSPASKDDQNVQTSESRVPTSTTPQNGSDGTKQPTTTPSTSAPKSSTPSTSTPSSSTPSTSVPKSSAPSTSTPESSHAPRTQNPQPSSGNNAPGGGNQRPGSNGGF
ncbi:hypothetical protein NDR87_36835 [Nocardia sp. CDC159]|uniref:Uncharacterized protein n=1 Tax=Nocardia pulmonis TaxID=2951408 RepID=A0A9X2EDT3_9NOCA|nr:MULTISPECIES: hypothetical protein [Nocardia]MCM6779054.1 hypothetical protein [Nocardia pulmonis]MCM6791944.1 hypothetical protein [Nocardia sp. CDC159]